MGSLLQTYVETVKQAAISCAMDARDARLLPACAITEFCRLLLARRQHSFQFNGPFPPIRKGIILPSRAGLLSRQSDPKHRL